MLKGKSIADLHELMVKGKLYVSIHTKDFPNGEIRGDSFVGMHRLFPDDADFLKKIVSIVDKHPSTLGYKIRG